MTTVSASEKLVSRPWPQSSRLIKPGVQIRSTHSAVCPTCTAEVRIKTDEFSADVFGGCQHFSSIEQVGDDIAITFKAAA